MRKQKVYFLIVLAGLIAYFPSVKYGFSQDDFIHFFSSKAENLAGFLNFFNPFYAFPDIFFYRPLTTQIYFFINRSLFGLNPLPFHLEGLILHLINSILFFSLIMKILNNRQIAFLSSIFYGVSAVHFLSLYYISAFQETGRMFFILLTFLLFFKKYYIGSLITFTAALLSKETSIITPLLIFLLEVMRKKDINIFKNIKTTLKAVVPFFVIILIYVTVRSAGLQSVFSEGAYNLSYSPSEIWQNLKWYVIWSFGLPEILSSYPSLKPESILQFGKDLPFGMLLVILTIIITLINIILFYQLRLIQKRVFFASAAFFLVALIPVMLLAGHRYPHYLDLSLVGFLPLLSMLYLQKTKFKKILGAFAIASFILIQFFSIRLSEQTHWTTHRVKVASYYEKVFKNSYLPDNAEVIFAGDNLNTRELSVALAQKYALMVWFPQKVRSVKYFSGYPELRRETEVVYPITVY